MAQNSTVESLTRSTQDKIDSVKDKVSEKLSNNDPSQYREGELTRRIEQQTAKIPSVGYLGLAIGSIVLSSGLAIFAERKTFANFVGLWAPTFLLLGIYNKMVKLEGGASDFMEKKKRSAA